MTEPRPIRDWVLVDAVIGPIRDRVVVVDEVKYRPSREKQIWRLLKQ